MTTDMRTDKARWRWSRANDAYLAGPGEGSANPRTRVYSCTAAPRGSRYRWTVAVNGTAVAVCRDTNTAMKVGRDWTAR